jgi:hypothetical protein
MMFTLVTVRAQIPGSALRLDGIDDHVVVASNASLTLSNQLTFEAWVFVEESKCNTILSRGDGGGNSDYIFQVGYNGVSCNARTIGFWAAGGWDSSASSVPLNAWTHVAVTYDGSNKRFYLNGVLDRTISRTGSVYQSGSPLFIGRQGTACNCNLFKGRIDELRIWNTVRTSNELSQNMSASLTGTETGLAAYYRFEEGGGPTTADATGHGNTGTLTNGTAWIAPNAPAAPGILSTKVSGGAIENLSLNASVIPNGNSTLAWFEWGRVPLHTQQTPPISLGTGSVAVPLNASLSGLTANATYYFRVVASNAAGLVRSDEKRFWAPQIVLNGPNPLTNECRSFVDPGASVRAPLQSVVVGAGGTALALRGDGSIVGWGNNTYGQLNILPSATNIIAVAAANHCVAARSDGSIIAWGRNDVFQTQVPPWLSDVIAVAANGLHSVALRSDGVVVAWSYYANGVVATEGISIAAGTQHGLAARANGTVAGWGNNTYGQITIPPSATNIIAVSAGSQHSVGLRSDGTVLVWGANSFEQLNIPPEATNVIAIAAAGLHTLALRADGTVVAWGNNVQGEAIVPATATNVIAITTSDFSSMALRADGTTVGWGSGPVVVPDSAYVLNISPAVSGAVDTAFGSYPVTYSVTNEVGISTAITRTVVVTDTTPPAVSLLGNNPLYVPMGTPFTEPGATATDFCAGDVSSNIVITGIVNTLIPAPYTRTYTVMDPSGNTGTNTRTIFVTGPPSVIGGNASVTGTNPTTGAGLVTLGANVVPNGLVATAWFQFGLQPAQFGSSPLINLPADYIHSNVTVNLGGLIPGVTYHYRAGASNSLGITYGPALTFAVPPIFPIGDSNGDGLVDDNELNAVLSNYWPNSPWLKMTNVAGLGGTNVTFALTNSVTGAFTVEYTTNLLNWFPLGLATPRYLFTDTNAPANLRRYYRLRHP